MYQTNSLKQGDFVIPVPVGLPITLQYNFSGNLERIYLRYSNDRIDVTSEFLDIFRKYQTVPFSLHVKKGITLVRGVLYTAELMHDPGHLPYCVENSLKSRFLESPAQFTFFSGSWESHEVPVQGSTAMRQILTMSRFKILPGWLVPPTLTSEVIRRWVGAPSYTFNPDMLTSYIIIRDDDVNYITTQMKQFVVGKIVKYTDENGYIKVRVYAKTTIGSGFPDFISIDYSELLNWDIQDGSLLVLDYTNQIVFNKPTTDKKPKKRSNQLSCSYCNKLFTIPKDGEVMCPDVHCVSRLIPRIRQFMTVVGLPVPTVDVISDWITKDGIRSIPDIFNLPEYGVGVVELKLTLASVLRSLVPYTLIPRIDVMKVFASNCTNNVDTFKHYCQNPQSAVIDLRMIHKDFGTLVKWLLDNYNLSDIEVLLSLPQITIEQHDKKFDGAPIFRGKTIYLTGNFIRGELSEIASILVSYSAQVILNLDDTVDCVVTGSTREDVNGEAVNRAKVLGIPVFEENQFFDTYEIDSDLRANQ